MNSIQITGNLTRDAEERRTSNGRVCAKFSVAVNRPYKQDVVDFFNCTAWGPIAEKVVLPYGKKGVKVGITGYMTFSKNTDDPSKVYSELSVENFELLSPKGSATATDNRAQQETAAQESGLLDGAEEVDDDTDMPF